LSILEGYFFVVGVVLNPDEKKVEWVGQTFLSATGQYIFGVPQGVLTLRNTLYQCAG